MIKAELVNIIPFKDGKSWYLKLIYEYENHEGKHAVIIPKAALPFSQEGLPPITNLASLEGAHSYISCNCSMSLYKSGCTLATELMTFLTLKTMIGEKRCLIRAIKRL